MPQIIITKDNSPTLFSEQFNAHYHSLFGAVKESQYVFVENGLKFFNQQHSKNAIKIIKILEIGWGTGLNCFLTFLEHQSNFIHQHIEYISIEKYPLENGIISQLSECYPFQQNKKLFLTLHSRELRIQLHQNFILQKIILDINDALHQIKENSIDIIYYDAFAPSSQPEMWNYSIFEKLYLLMNTNAVLVTFCAKGEFKRMLKKIGFIVENPPGAAGKREMTRAIKK
ncbi:MAG: tRNA (5-methylaminomethyl-2-thiouridine)(34)-methyltransferase MnmD [Bacteroidota bacterium]